MIFISLSLTDTFLDTPDSCIVIPYNVSINSIVFFLWVIIINCVLSRYLLRYSPKASTLASSSAAYTSSNRQNGTGLTFSIANNSDIAVNVFSPPDNDCIFLRFFPGGVASSSIPVSSTLSGLVI
mgnify:CR=1 FL=1